MKCEISFFKACDIEANALSESIYKIYKDSYTKSKYPVASLWSKESMFQKFPDSEFIVLKSMQKEENLRAFMHYRTVDSDLIEIWSLGVEPACWGSGLGDIILKKLQDKARNVKSSIVLEVHSRNKAAINLYSRNNWVIMRSITNYYGDAGDGLLMKWDLDKNILE